MKRLLLILLVILTYWSFLFSQSVYHKVFDSSQFSYQGVVYQVREDLDGKIWLGTDNGIAHFDGVRFHTITLDEIQDKNITLLAPDSFNRIWFLNPSGDLGYIQDKKPKIVFSSNSDSKIINFFIENNAIVLVFEQSTTRWFERHSLGEECNLDIPICTSEKINNNVLGFHSTAFDEGVIFITTGSIFRLDSLLTLQKNSEYNLKGDIFKYIRTNGNKVFWFSNDSLFSINKKFELNAEVHWEKSIRNYLVLDNLVLFFTNPTGLTIYNIESKQFLNTGLDNYTINEAFLDSRGIIWLGTDNAGLIAIPDLPSNYLKNSFVEYDPSIQVLKEHNKKIVVGSYDGALYTIEANKSDHLLSNGSSIINIEIIDSTLVVFRDESLELFNASLNLDYVIEKSSVKSLSKGNHSYYLGLNNGIFLIPFDTFPIPTPLDTRVIRAQETISKVKSNFSYTYDSLSYFSCLRQILVFDRFEERFVDTIFLPKSIVVENMISDTMGRLWLATNMGLWFYQDNSLRQFDFLHYPTTPIHFLYLEGNYLWVVGSDFLAKLNLISLDIEHAKSMMKNQEINALISKSDSLFLATNMGLLRTSQHHMLNQEAMGRVWIKKVIGSIPFHKLANDVKHWRSGLKSLHIELDGYDYSCPKVFTKHYSLNDVVYSTLEGDIIFQNLKPGLYTFRLSRNPRYYDPDDLEEFKFYVEFPLYSNRWFLILSGLTLIVLTSLTIKLFNDKKRKRQEKTIALERELENLKLLALQRKMNPHFINNVLSSIKYYIAFKTQDQASEIVDQLAILMRQTYIYANARSISLKDEIQFLRSYVQLETNLKSEKIEFTINHPTISKSSLGQITIPVFLLQPLIENSIKYRMVGEILKIGLNIDKTGNSLLVKIADNGRGYNYVKDAKKHSSLGVIQRRLNVLNKKEENTFFISENMPNGTIVQIKIRLHDTYSI